MAKIYSNNIKQIIDTDNLSSFYLVQIDYKTGTVFHTSTPMDINVVGIGLFSSDNNLKGIEAPRLSAVVDRETYKITYSDNHQELRAKFDQGIVGTPVTVWVGLYNTSDVVINGILPGQPFSAKSDLIVAYKGVIDTHGYATDVDTEITALIECSSPMASLDLNKPFYTSKDSMKQINPNDTSFDDVYSGSKAVNLVWGKK